MFRNFFVGVIALFFVFPIFAYTGTVDGSDGIWTDRIILISTTPSADKIFEDATVIENFDFSLGSGGAINAKTGFALGKNMILQNNIANHATDDAHGGAVYLDGSYTVNIGEGTKFLTNSAKNDGGALYLKGSSAVYSFGFNVEFEGNSAVNGGGAYVNLGRFSLSDGAKFTNNYASVDGGAIYNNAGTLFIYKADFIDNGKDSTDTVQTVNGGALYLKGGTTYIRGNTNFEGNEVSGLGGAIYQETGTLNVYTDMADVKFKTATDSVYSKNATINVYGSKVVDGNATTFEMVGESDTTRGKLNITTATLEFDTITLGDYTTLDVGIEKDTVSGGVKNGKLVANTYNISDTGAKMIFTVGQNAIDKFDANGNPNIVVVTVFDGMTADEYGANLTISNNLYNITWAGNGQYEISRIDSISTADIVLTNGGDPDLARVAKAWTDSSDFRTGTVGATFANKLYALAQNDANAYLDVLTALAPSKSKFIYEMTTEKISQLHKQVSNRLGASYAMDKEIDKHYEGFWVDGLYNSSKYKNSGRDGFDNNSYGGVIGYDGDATINLRMGIAYGYSRTDGDVLGKDVVADDHSFLLYGQYLIDENWFFDGIFSYTYSNVNEAKNVSGLQVNAESDIEMAGLQLSSGYLVGSKTFNIAPEIGVRFTNVSQGNYDDTASQDIRGNSFANLTGFGRLSLNTAKLWEDGSKIRFQIYGGAGYDAWVQNAKYHVLLSNGAWYEIESEYFDKLSYEAGANFTWQTSGMLRLSVGYDGKFREEYQDHSVNFVIGLQF